MSAALVLRNTAWRISSLPPAGICGSRFREIDPIRASHVREGSGADRMFSVAWSGRGPANHATDRERIDADHRYHIMVAYWAGRGWQDTMQLVAEDQVAIAHAIRRDDWYVGVPEDETAELGIVSREIASMDLSLGDEASPEAMWVLRVDVVVHLIEVT